jgi:hypothetical protein
MFSKNTQNIKFHESLFIGSRVFPCRKTEGLREKHDEASSRFSQFK